MFYHGARYYASWLSHWLSVDPYLVTPERTDSPPSNPLSTPTTKWIRDIKSGKSAALSSTRMNSYCYSLDNPVNLVDPDGAEPTREKVGEIKNFLNHVRKLEKIYTDEFKAKEGAEPDFLTTIAVNRKILEKFKDYKTWDVPGERYIYTKRGGWIDMAHFAKAAGEIGTSWWGDRPILGSLGRRIAENRGRELEAGQQSTASRSSAFSYEDLPSNRFGFEFGSDIDLGRPLSAQLDQFFQALQPTKPQNAPNWRALPKTGKDAQTHEPPRNLTDQPLFTIPSNGNQPTTPENWQKMREKVENLKRMGW